VDGASLAGKITVRLGVAEDVAEETASIDTIWCRDVIEVLPDLPMRWLRCAGSCELVAI